MSVFYAYIHAKPGAVDASGIFYVGKGKNARIHDYSHRNRHHKNIVAKYGKENILAGRIDCSDEAIAMLLEQGLIKCLRRMGVKLANVTAGGEGLTGHKHSEATRQKMREAALGRVQTEQTRAKLRAANLGKPGTFTGKTHTTETRAKISASRSGRPNPHIALLQTPEARAKMSATKLALPFADCPHCGFYGKHGSAMKRYHFDNCKKRGSD
jgi:group I intron endonuclease